MESPYSPHTGSIREGIHRKRVSFGLTVIAGLEIFAGACALGWKILPKEKREYIAERCSSFLYSSPTRTNPHYFSKQEIKDIMDERNYTIYGTRKVYDISSVDEQMLLEQCRIFCEGTLPANSQDNSEKSSEENPADAEIIDSPIDNPESTEGMEIRDS